jgi:predicted PurR-regulated permease PerM
MATVFFGALGTFLGIPCGGVVVIGIEVWRLGRERSTIKE